MIELELEKRGVRVRINSVPEFRSRFPGFVGRTDLKGLQLIAESIATADLELWQLKKNRPRLHISKARIREMRANGETLKAIAQKAKVSRARIHQILKEQQND